MACIADWLARYALFEQELAGSLVFHQLLLLLSSAFMSLAVGISCWLILDHALHHLKPYEQKQ
jgi:hypothetical protein